MNIYEPGDRELSPRHPVSKLNSKQLKYNQQYTTIDADDTISPDVNEGSSIMEDETET